VSDSILYLAIVAIWVGFLIPAWLRRPHATREVAVDLEPDVQIDADAGVPLRRRADDVARTASTPHRNAEGPEYGYDVHTHNYGPAAPRSRDTSGYAPPDYGPAVYRPPVYGPSQSRAQMMRARPRMLGILAGLVMITAAFVYAGYVQWWICVPPVAMLILYVLLLREIAIADAELARKRAAWEAREARAAQATRDVWRRSHQAWQAEAEASAGAHAGGRGEAAGEPTAKIIDISGRVGGDQLYDQYADAAVRAVGD